MYLGNFGTASALNLASGCGTMTLRRETILMTIAALLTVGLRQPLSVSGPSGSFSWPTGDFDKTSPLKKSRSGPNSARNPGP
jgi:hypothetical protein